MMIMGKGPHESQWLIHLSTQPVLARLSSQRWKFVVALFPSELIIALNPVGAA